MVVKYTFCPTRNFDTSASETCDCTVMVERSAMRTTIGAAWLALSVCPCLAFSETTVPDIGA